RRSCAAPAADGGLFAPLRGAHAGFLHEKPVDGLGAHAALAAQSAAVAVSAGCASSALLAFSTSYPMLLVASAVVGVGSATFHPEASRVARMASGGRFGTAQSTFQVGGNTGSAIGPLLAAAIVIPYGQHAIAWFMLAAALAVFVLSRLTAWTIRHGQAQLKSLAGNQVVGLNRAQVIQAIVVIAILMFAKFVYIAAFTNYFAFYLIERFSMSVQESQIYLFIFLAAVAAGTFA